MGIVSLVEYAEAGPEVRAVYDEIMKARGSDWVNNFWKALAHDPALLRRTWESVKQVMGPGTLDPLVKELVYLAVSATNGCEYCSYSHTAAARKKGMTDAMLDGTDGGSRPRQRDQPPRQRAAHPRRPPVPLGGRFAAPRGRGICDRSATAGVGPEYHPDGFGGGKGK